MADRQLRARCPEEVINEVEKITKIIEKENPGAEATISTIVRYAIKDYVERFWERRNRRGL